jgi:C_GCAxxG_C_C family probable redox protein
MRIASGFGGGMRMGRTCGAISGGIMVLGLAYGFDQIGDEAGKQKIEEIVGSYVRNMQAILGTCDCNELLGIDVTQPQIRKQAKADGLFREKCPGFIEAVINELERLLPQS